MKAKYIFLATLLLFARGCDFYSTSLWFFQPGGMDGEMNPLTRYFGAGWYGLLFANALVVGLVLYAFYSYMFRYKRRTLKKVPENLPDFVSELYFDERGKFLQVFYRMPNDKSMFVAHIGYVLIRVIIVGSFLATIHNLCQYYDVALYNSYREIVGRPLYVIYVLILGSGVFFMRQLWKLEYKAALVRKVAR